MSTSLRNGIIAGLIFVILVGGGVVGLRLLQARNKAAQDAALSDEEIATVQVIEARRGDIERSFLFSGSLEANRKAGVVSKIPGKVSRVHVDEGQWVNKGQLLVELERADLLAQREQARAMVQAAEARLKQAETGQTLQSAESSTTLETAQAGLAAAEAQREQARVSLELAKSQTRVGIQQAEEQLKQAQARMAMVQTGARDQEIAIAEEAVQQAQANVDTARKNRERARNLLADGAISQQQFDAAQLQYDTASAGYNSARQRLDLVKEGARSEEIDIARAQVNQAQAALVLAQANQSQVAIREQQLQAAAEAVRQAQAGLRMAQAALARNAVSEQDTEAARSVLAQAQANLQYLNVQIGYTYVRAPISGYVVKRYIQPGEAASPGMPLVRIVDNRSLYLRSRIAEGRINKLFKGQQVTINIDALPEAEFAGRITDIVPVADPESRTFEVKIEVPNERGLLKSGLFGRARVVTERKQQVILVPRHAVAEDESGAYLFAVKADVIKRQKVTTGLNNETDVVITEGVSAGTKVIVRGQTLVKDGQRVKVQWSD